MVASMFAREKRLTWTGCLAMRVRAGCMALP